MNYFANLLFIIIISPFLLLVLLFIFLLIFIIDGSPIFFKQKRIGKNNVVFNLYKFRTMKLSTDQISFDKEIDKARITYLGYFLRKLSLDEIPEFLNILKNEMSLVGPRPLPVEYIDYFDNNKSRHTVLPGLTGLCQINGRNSLSWEERFELDNEYIKNRNLILDFKIIIKTIYLFISLKAIINDRDLTSNKLEK